VTNGGIIGFPSTTGAASQLDARYAAAAPPPPAGGNYFYTACESTTSTSNTLGNGTLRVAPWLVGRTVTIDRLGAECTSAGEASSLFRLGIFRDNGSCYPGSLLVDAGTIAGDSATVQVATISNLTIPPGLYWIGGAVQAAPSSQPTMRTMGTWVPPVHFPIGTATPGTAGSPYGYSATSVTGALPAVFSSTLSLAGSAVRVFARVAY
jgi:hypothetical protein